MPLDKAFYETTPDSNDESVSYLGTTTNGFENARRPISNPTRFDLARIESESALQPLAERRAR